MSHANPDTGKRLVRLREVARQRRDLEQETGDLITELARDAGVTYHEIADAAGFGPTSGTELVRRYARRAGLGPRKGGPRRRDTT